MKYGAHILELTISVSFQERFSQSNQGENALECTNKLEVSKSNTIPTDLEIEGLTKGKLARPTCATFTAPKVVKTVPFKSPLQNTSTENSLGELFSVAGLSCISYFL